MLQARAARDDRSFDRPVSYKTRATACEIQAWMKTRIECGAERDGQCRSCGVPLPQALMRSVRADEPNWTVISLPHLASGCFGAIVDEARRRFELID